MMVAVMVRDKYVETLSVFGDVQSAVDLALERYTIEQIMTKVSQLKQRQAEFQAKYGMEFAAFAERVKGDENFVRDVESKISPTWEADLFDWEFCVKGIQDWTQRLQNFLLE